MHVRKVIICTHTRTSCIILHDCQYCAPNTNFLLLYDVYTVSPNIRPRTCIFMTIVINIIRSCMQGKHSKNSSSVMFRMRIWLIWIRLASAIFMFMLLQNLTYLCMCMSPNHSLNTRYCMCATIILWKFHPVDSLCGLCRSMHVRTGIQLH